MQANGTVNSEMLYSRKLKTFGSGTNVCIETAVV
jgi:hypothetical protein